MTYDPRPNGRAMMALVLLAMVACIIIAGTAHASTGGTPAPAGKFTGMGWRYAPDYVTAVKPGGFVQLPKCTTEVDVRAVNKPQQRLHQDYLGIVTEQGRAYGWISRGRSVNVVWLTAWHEIYAYGNRPAIVAAWCS